jgi:hypothetical protein
MTRVHMSVSRLAVLTGMCRLQSSHAGSSLTDFSALKMEAIRSSETSVRTRSTLRHIQEDDNLHTLFYFATLTVYQII